jgi:predicted lipoprotein with Yx(FWY)xxD motif
MQQMKFSILTRFSAGLLILVLFLAGCAANSASSSGANDSTPTATPTPGAPVVLISSSPGLGSFLVDARGMALYINSKDSPGVSTCTGICTNTWPPLTVTGAPVAGIGVAGGMLGVLARPDGRQQVTYDGWPLYYFTGDRRPGYPSGQGFAGVWFAALLANTVQQLSMQLTPTPNGLPGVPNAGGNSSQSQNPAPLMTRPTPRAFPRFGGGGGRGRR